MSANESNQGLSLIQPRYVPPLDQGFRPAVLANRAFTRLVEESGGGVPVKIALERAGGGISRLDTAVLPDSHSGADGNFLYVERILKFLLWSRGGFRVHFSGPSSLLEQLQRHYSESATGRFDADLMGNQIFGQPFEVVGVAAEAVPKEKDSTAPLGKHLDGCRIGFDLGASDRKIAAVQDGKTVFSEEVVWDPKNQTDPQWHFDKINEVLHMAAKKLPRVDAIGGSSAGVYVDNEVRVASLFRGVPAEQFAEKVKPLFLNLRKEWNNIPFDVVNDGDVTALAGAMSLDDNAVLGIALGSSEAAGYVNADGNITGWLNELAFVPIDYNPDAAVDEWSGDYGCGVQYFSQQCVGRLIPSAGLEIDDTLGLPEKLVKVQEFMAAGDSRAAAIYETIGICLGYALAHYASFYDFRHLLILGRVTTGQGGEIINEKAKTVLREEFPELQVAFHIPDEKEKRHGQAMAAASLPVIE